MLPYLNTDSPFPSVQNALDDPNGLLAAGADLSVGRLLDAYKNGIFPWYSPGDPLLWWSPDPRTVFALEKFKVHSSVKKTLKKNKLIVTVNHDFKQVIHSCALPRGDNEGTWITNEMKEAYIHLHQLGHAHSVEVWQENTLVGGIYGVSCGSVFCGESMFSKISNGSKIALSCLATYIKQFAYQLVDCQVENPHLIKLGAINISRSSYLESLKIPPTLPNNKDIWQTQNLDWRQLLGINSNV
ncbi:leucyl/phenylalanyl-tRNA--protein transferase [Aliikangiella sp. IMCC44359]|uniref:leucyl/phenylalanyl-tRNA--protein transferase n=1 Tax=Aliikangiella sp. IMCC44359 TaxID=3459125 RepID=UPI00403A88DA